MDVSWELSLPWMWSQTPDSPPAESVIICYLTLTVCSYHPNSIVEEIFRIHENFSRKSPFLVPYLLALQRSDRSLRTRIWNPCRPNFYHSTDRSDSSSLFARSDSQSWGNNDFLSCPLCDMWSFWWFQIGIDHKRKPRQVSVVIV